MIATDQLRFLPAAGFNAAATLVARAWDGFTGAADNSADARGAGGATAFSSSAVTLSVAPASPSPSWAGVTTTLMPQLTPVLPGASQPAGDLVDAIFGAFFRDGQPGLAPGIAVTALNATPAQGAWQYSLDNGDSWNAVTVSPRSALLLSGAACLRFVPHVGFLGSVSLTAYAWDGSGGPAGTFAPVHGVGFSGTTLTATCLVNTGPTLIP